MNNSIDGLILSLLLCSSFTDAFAQGTAFTYQGNLTDNGSPATGTYNFRFRLMASPDSDSPVPGTPILEIAPVSVSDGLFTVLLDFGGGFDGTPRWLQIAVRTNSPAAGGPAYTQLLPWQAVTPAPYAIRAAGVTGPVAASQLAGTIQSDNIAAGTITSTMLAPGSVTGAALADGAVSANKIHIVTNLTTTAFAPPNPSANDYFGWTMAAGSGRVAITAPLAAVSGFESGIAYLFDDAGQWLASCTNPVPAPLEGFGSSVAIAGTNRVLVGALFASTSGPESGGAYLFDFSGRLLTTITNPSPSCYEFGNSVAAVGGKRVVIGAPNSGGSGAAFVYDLYGNLLTTITNLVPSVGDMFGFSVAAVGSDRVLIGALGTGAAYLFDLSGRHLATFVNPTPSSGDGFGAAVLGVGDNRVLVGSPYNDTGANDSGAVHLFSTHGTWLATFTNPAPASLAYFGSTLAASGTNQLLIGAPSGDRSAAGKAYLLDGLGNLQQTFVNPSSTPNDQFGFSAAALGPNRMLIGAPSDDSVALDAGAASLLSFSRSAPGFDLGLFGGVISSEQLPATAARLDANQTFTGTVSFDDPANTFRGSFSGNGAGLTNIDSHGLTGILSVRPGVILGVGSTTYEGTFVRSVAVAGNYAYVGRDNAGILVYDLRNPSHPLAVGAATYTGLTHDLVADGQYLYAANDTNGLRVLDISNPTQPVTVCQTNDGGAALRLVVRGDYVYLANGDDGLRIYDRSQPTRVINVGHLGRRQVIGIAVCENNAYVLIEDFGPAVCDISNPARPFLARGLWNSDSYTSGITVSGRYAYVVGYWLQVYDLTDPAAPERIASLSTSDDDPTEIAQHSRDVVAVGQYIYIGRESIANPSFFGSLRVYDVRNPAVPVRVGLRPQDTYPTLDLTVAGDYLYVASGNRLNIHQVGVLAFQGDGSELTRLDASNITDGVLNDRHLSRNVAKLDQAQTFTAVNWFTNSGNSFTGDGAGLTGLNASSLVTGRVTDDLLSPNIARLDADQLFRGRNSFFGRIGIGMHNPAAPLHVEGSAPSIDTSTVVLSAPLIGPNVSHVHFGTSGDWHIRSAAETGKVILQDSGGNVGIGTDDPQFRLHVAGGAAKPGGGLWSNASDERLKTNINTLHGALDKLLALRGVSFNYKEPEKIHELPGEQLGLIAQEVERVFPQWVEEARDGFKRVTVRGLEALVVEALRELRAEKDARIAELEEKSDRLEQRLNALERLSTPASKPPLASRATGEVPAIAGR